jgi:type III restriction enzyme
MDILSRINWNDVNFDDVKNLLLSELKISEDEITYGLSDDIKEVIKEKKRLSKVGGLELDYVFVTRQLLDIVPNPWLAHEMGKNVIESLLAKYDRKMVTDNLVFIIEEIRKQLVKEKDRLSEFIFSDLIQQKKLWFFLLADKGGYKLPRSIRIKRGTKALIRDDNLQIERSLFDYVPEEDFNTMEKSIAIYLDEQEKLLWWYRNLSRQDYFIQGWRKNKIYPDFVFSKSDDTGKNFKKVFVVETKGIQFKDNEDTKYKKSVFKFCNELGQQKEWKELNKEFSKGIEFQVIYEDEWKKRINEIFEI